MAYAGKPSSKPSKTLASALIFGLFVLFALPGVRHALPARSRPRDSFPASTFPMFASPMPEAHRMTWVRGVDAQGTSLGNVPARVFSSAGINQTMAHIGAVRRAEPALRQQICQEVAQRVATRKSLSGVQRIEIVDGYYRPEKVFGPERDDRPERAQVLVSCAVSHGAKA